MLIRDRKPDTRARLRRVPSSVQPLPFFLLHSTVRPRRDWARRRNGEASCKATPAIERAEPRQSRHSEESLAASKAAALAAGTLRACSQSRRACVAQVFRA